jgi:hypothetical protein
MQSSSKSSMPPDGQDFEMNLGPFATIGRMLYNNTPAQRNTSTQKEHLAVTGYSIPE